MLILATHHLGTALSFADGKVFSELVESFQDLSGTPLSKGRAGDLPLTGGVFVLSAAACWIGYKLRNAAFAFGLLQLAVVSVIYQWLCWRFVGLSDGYPVSNLLAILLSGGGGLIVRRAEEQRRLAEAARIELELRNRELNESRLAMVTQDERERRLMAADLHDQVLNDLKKIVQKVEADTPAAEVRRELKNVMESIREIMDNLAPVMLEHFGLAAAIEDILEKGAQRSAFEFKFEQLAPEAALKNFDAIEQQLLYRLVQESITNICKHAQAKHVTVSIKQDAGQLIFSVDDDGVGLKQGALSDSSRGLLYMKLRAALIGANLHWSVPESGIGTRLEIRTRPAKEPEVKP